MEKLLRDLNIYAHSFMNCNLTFTHDGNRIRVQWDEIWPYVAESIILNKKFWFIKWLVENEKVNPYDPSYNVPTHIALWVDDWDGDFMVYERFFKEEELLMLLSIQDEPINFLVSILK